MNRSEFTFFIKKIYIFSNVHWEGVTFSAKFNHKYVSDKKQINFSGIWKNYLFQTTIIILPTLPFPRLKWKCSWKQWWFIYTVWNNYLFVINLQNLHKNRSFQSSLGVSQQGCNILYYSVYSSTEIHFETCSTWCNEFNGINEIIPNFLSNKVEEILLLTWYLRVFAND